MKNKLLNDVLEYYLNSKDYNLYPITKLYEQNLEIENTKNIIIELIKDNILDLYYCETNYYIKNFNLQIPLEKKIDYINNLPKNYTPHFIENIKIDKENCIQITCNDEIPPISLFPTPTTIKKYIKNKVQYNNIAPFNKMLLEGTPHLKFLYFRIDVLNRFIYDPRYMVYNIDYSGRIYYNEDNKKKEQDENHIYLSHFGLAYNKKTNENVITIFPHDLAKLSLKHQYYFYSYLFDNQEDFIPDISYYQNVMGEFSEGLSIFSAFFEEMKLINKMFNTICAKNLIKNIFEFTQQNRPEYFHPFLMPTKTMYHNFCRTLYRLFIDQLDKNAMIEFAKEIGIELDTGKKGSMSLLQELFNKGFKSFNGNNLGDEIINIWKKTIHEHRNKISHSFVDDIYDVNIFQEYRYTINEAYKSIRLIRLVLSTISVIKNSIENNKIEISEDLYRGNIKMHFAPFK